MVKKVGDLTRAAGVTTRDFTRSAKRRALNILKFTKGKNDDAKKAVKRAYQELCEITQLLQLIAASSLPRMKTRRNNFTFNMSDFQQKENSQEPSLPTPHKLHVTCSPDLMGRGFWRM
jgi:hypothetical protein